MAEFSIRKHGIAGLLALGGVGLAVGRGARWLRSRSALKGEKGLSPGRGRPVALITGGARGLGLAIARLLGARGFMLVLVSRNEDQLRGAREELKSRGITVCTCACDVSDADEVEEMIRDVLTEYGRIDLLVNCAGVIQVGPAQGMSLKDYEDAMASNFWGIVNTTLAVAPEMASRGQGRILNITSQGAVVPIPHLAPYTASKFAAFGFSTAFGVEARSQGISVTTAVPGLMRTGSYVNALFKGDREAEYRWFSMGATYPLVSMDADRAARKLLEACFAGDPVYVMGWQAKLSRIAFALMPNLSFRLLQKGNDWVLPDGHGTRFREQRAEPGWKVRQGLRKLSETRWGEHATRAYREL